LRVHLAAGCIGGMSFPKHEEVGMVPLKKSARYKKDHES